MTRKPLKHQIVGYSNSGKTTLASKLIDAITKNGSKVATIKHHGHDQDPLVKEAEVKDSVKHRQAGALGTLVASENELNLIMNSEKILLLDDYIQMYQPFDLDVIIIEGFKNEGYPKTIMIRTIEDQVLINHTSFIEAVICWDEELVDKWGKEYSFPVFHLTETEKYLNWFKQQIL